MTFPAHIRNGKGCQIQTVQQHNRKVAEHAAESLAKMNLYFLAYLAGLLHDCGKFTETFRTYIEQAAEGKHVIRGSVNHSFAGVRLILQLGRPEKAQTHEIQLQQLSSELIAFAIGCHHGLFDCIDQDGRNGFVRRTQEEQILTTEAINNFSVYCASTAECKTLFEKAIDEVAALREKLGFLCETAASQSTDKALIYTIFDFYLGMTAKMLTSAVIQGDRCDTAEFMGDCNTMGLNLAGKQDSFWQDLLNNLEKKLCQLSEEMSEKLIHVQYSIVKARMEISEQCRKMAETENNLFRLNVPTGSGKTLSSLRFALARAAKNDCSRIIYVMPLLSIIEQNADVLRWAVGRDDIVLEHHSNVIQDDSDQEEQSLRERMTESWDAPIIITTMVQFLQTLFSDKTSCIRRMQSLVNSVVVFDEIQSLPIHMTSQFSMAVNFLTGCCGTTVVLCSATQPFGDGKNKRENLRYTIVPPEEMVPYKKELWQIFNRTQIIPEKARNLDQIAAFATEQLQDTTSLLIICNLKSEALYLFELLRQESNCCFHLSAGMCTQHRRDCMQTMKKAMKCLANKQSGAKKVICVSTQVIEAGVDISFQRVIRLAAGMDSIVQAAGRCNRNREQDSPAPVYVIPCNAERLTRLPEMRAGVSATLTLLKDYEEDGGKYQNDLTSEYAIRKYYDTLYGQHTEDYFDYTFLIDQDKKNSATQMDLLSSNLKFAGRAENKDYLLKQASKTAGQYFQALESNTLDIIVPYKEGEELIAELQRINTDYNPEALYRILQCAKPYSIAIYQWQYEKLNESGMVIPVLDNDGRTLAYTLNSACYSPDSGLTILESNGLFC